jgi:hypothetical protein
MPVLLPGRRDQGVERTVVQRHEVQVDEVFRLGSPEERAPSHRMGRTDEGLGSAVISTLDPEKGASGAESRHALPG